MRLWPFYRFGMRTDAVSEWLALVVGTVVRGVVQGCSG